MDRRWIGRIYKLTRSEDGFTLFEVLVTIAVLSVVFLLVALFMKMGFDAYADNSERIRMQQFTQITIQKIASELNKAVVITIDPDGGGLTFSYGDSVYYYYLDESAQQIKRQFTRNGTNTVVSVLHSSDMKVMGFTFSDHGDYIQIGITLQTKKNAYNNRSEYRISTDIPAPNRQQ